ncbi:DNA-binding NarL/FixJ family response regulator [Cupriavidus metallidurans]|jgi:DNA-binding NarL/FixJ family response regulator|uniref:Transcriptional regulator, LuxR family n=1 Tax=Cupriavidus metallidurans (strain ATCC 43123 / DSM 2839 / NBRC 102507 / CH34) TaxID=266264 RepID=Q1LAV6_CUPMC|nr:LuxR C-terminal-related transcriptional regulator [Cupriavidus metallidurans]ABF12720.1 transcriptional regulator, LuxR family [Cupriavidus metallidurans CH34]AVA35377.1 DNA-binding response regulator [Cupriavidus metallidurans]KWW33161.1 putative HTH-type transcriptional regulator YhjB [Cupriavidus metallidurans]MDE4921011.1 LuxR C-terminal-related transcriptional regulator [Cupriavidus metallidurans]QGS32099.1 DNA-binding response regulator [Cupriavidus metallidurans]
MNALLIEEHPLLRLGLLQMLETIQEFGHVLALSPADVARTEVPHRNAELLVFGMPGDQAYGWAQLEQARERLAPQRILVLADALPLHVPNAEAARGICGCLPKSTSLPVIEAAIRLTISSVQGLMLASEVCATPSASRSAMHATQSLASAAPLPLPPAMQEPLSPGACASVLRTTVAVRDLTSLRPGQPISSSAAPLSPMVEEEPGYDEAEMLQITPRQYEVLVLLARGYPIKTVSRMLNISVATVKSHACTLYQRLKVRNKGEAVYAALQRGATLEWVHGDEHSARDGGVRRVIARGPDAQYDSSLPA